MCEKLIDLGDIVVRANEILHLSKDIVLGYESGMIIDVDIHKDIMYKWGSSFDYVTGLDDVVSHKTHIVYLKVDGKCVSYILHFVCGYGDGWSGYFGSYVDLINNIKKDIDLVNTEDIQKLIDSLCVSRNTKESIMKSIYFSKLEYCDNIKVNLRGLCV